MSRGGARIRSGPAPDPTALRHGDLGDWLKLPATAVEDPAPAWPLEGRGDREFALWTRLWRMPQARIWRRNSQELEVAMHSRTFAEAEAFGASTAMRTLVRQQQDALLLTIPGLRGAKVLIVDAAAAEQPPADSRVSRDRLRVLAGGDPA